MKKLIQSVCLGTALLFGAASASANVITQDLEIEYLGNNSSSVEYVYFDVTTAGTFDISATSNSAVDTYIYLLDDDGALSPDDLIASDDDGGPGLNSFLSLFLGVDSYVLAVGDFFLGIDDVVSGVNPDDSNTEFGSVTVEISSIDGHAVATSVSAPSATVLLGLGLLGLAARRKKIA